MKEPVYKSTLKNGVKLLMVLIAFVFVVSAVNPLAKWFSIKIFGQSEITGVHTETVIVPGDAVPQVSKNYVPVITRSESVKITDKVDTAAILADYFAKRTYVDTLRNDSSLLAVVIDTVSQNGIVSRHFITQNRRPVAMLTTTVYKTETDGRKIELYAGAWGGYMVKHARPCFGPEITLTVNRSVNLRYGYDILNNGHMGGVALKLTGKK